MAFWNSLSDPLKAALITGVLGPLGGLLVYWITSQRMKVLVTIRLGKMHRSSAEYMLYSHVKHDQEIGRTLDALSRQHTYVEMTIENKSSKTLRHVNIIMEKSDIAYSYQLDGETQLVIANRKDPITIAELQPKEKRKVHVWLTGDYISGPFSSLRGFCQVRAEELHHTGFRYPIPDYIVFTYLGMVWKGLIIGMVLFSVVSIALRLLQL